MSELIEEANKLIAEFNSILSRTSNALPDNMCAVYKNDLRNLIKYAEQLEQQNE